MSDPLAALPCGHVWPEGFGACGAPAENPVHVGGFWHAESIHEHVPWDRRSGSDRRALAAPAEGLREAAQPILDRALDVFDPDDLDPESSLALPVTLKARWVYALRAALAAPAEGLDVERLARAMAEESASRDGTGLGWATLSGPVRDLWRTSAARIAREYAALEADR